MPLLALREEMKHYSWRVDLMESILKTHVTILAFPNITQESVRIKGFLNMRQVEKIRNERWCNRQEMKEMWGEVKDYDEKDDWNGIYDHWWDDIFCLRRLFGDEQYPPEPVKEPLWV
ncbi:uncharacterized protein LOC114940008 [Nylanderia fulva]|uniref:uncharacterized protein LOC114940008 n=1 Tax=Nylanderia fulva TaxID=613905 RepID=UPI0010FB6B5A|nr:uncharacterized protein LOC114940008 [Nylanderia fulva]